MVPRRLRAALAAALSAGCVDAAPPTTAVSPAALESAGPAPRAAAGDAPGSAPALRLAPDEHLVDLRDDGAALVGREEPVPENADPLRLLRLLWIEAGVARPWTYDGVPVQAARFGPDGGVWVATRERQLVWLSAPGAEPETRDEDVLAPLSVSVDRRVVAYARGVVPELEIARAEHGVGRAAALTRGLAPAWAPALSADGRRIRFVSAAEGAPALYEVSLNAGVRLLLGPDRLPGFPVGPDAPVWRRSGLAFAGPDGPVELALDDDAERVASAGAPPPLRRRPGRAIESGGQRLELVVAEDGALRRLGAEEVE
jgi:hypothetical protein